MKEKGETLTPSTWGVHDYWYYNLMRNQAGLEMLQHSPYRSSQVRSKLVQSYTKLEKVQVQELLNMFRRC